MYKSNWNLFFFPISSFALESINFSSATVYSLLTFGLFLIDFALIPNRHVLIVSDSLNGEGEQVTIRVVFEGNMDVSIAKGSNFLTKEKGEENGNKKITPKK